VCELIIVQCEEGAIGSEHRRRTTKTRLVVSQAGRQDYYLPGGDGSGDEDRDDPFGSSVSLPFPLDQNGKSGPLEALLSAPVSSLPKISSYARGGDVGGDGGDGGRDFQLSTGCSSLIRGYVTQSCASSNSMKQIAVRFLRRPASEPLCSRLFSWSLLSFLAEQCVNESAGPGARTGRR
jgi:hypothetical protein